MLSAFVVSLFTTAGAMAWIYNKTMNKTGSNTKTALTTAGVSGVVIFIAGLIVFGILFSIDF